MKKIFFAIGLIIAIVLASGCVQSSNSNNPPGANGNNPPSSNPETKTVEITVSGFNPSTLEINAGDTVIFENKGTAQHRPASDVHPTHNEYPEPGGCVGSKFDACKNLAQGESFSFTFNIKGTWTYHDHLNPSLSGTIIVK